MPDTALLDEFDVNVVSAHRVTAALMPLLQKGRGKTIVNMCEGGRSSHLLLC